MGWYKVVKTIKGHRYVYEQRTWREGKHVRTESRYVGPAESDLRAQRAGMSRRERWSGWDREPCTSESQRLVAVWELPLS